MDVLDKTFPFRFLPAADLAELRSRLIPFAAASGELLFAAGDAGDRSVYLLDDGEVEVVGDNGEVLTVIGAGHYFGERAALFDEPRRFAVRAVGPVRGSRLPGAVFLAALAGSPTLAHAFARILREKQGLFAAFDTFVAKLLSSVAAGSIDLDDLLPAYLALHPALHPRAAGPVIDTDALSYAVRRLPTNIATTLALFLTDDLPPIHRDPDATFRAVATGARPRSTYEMLPGKSMVLLRDGISDLIDLVSCLCVYAVEARKIRNRLEDPVTLLALSHGEVAPEALRFSADELAGLRAIWSDRLIEQLRDMVFHHEDFTIKIRKQLNNYNSRHSERWTAQVAVAAEALLGVEPGHLVEADTVHIVSSNTHSVANCLSPWLQEHTAEILAWAESRRHPVLAERWDHAADAVVALSRDWFTAHPDAARERAEADRACGLLSLNETVFTGIEVGLVDLGRLAGKQVDPGLPPVPESPGRELLVNIDFAFGQQAAEIIGGLITLFGHRIASINILGKAGAIVGKRGDILHPTAFVDQTQEVSETLHPQPVDLARLRARVPGREVHVGPLLTVPGTLLQNRQMLQFYRRLWGCVGLEMEGCYYWRRIDEAIRLGLLRPDVPTRFLYYVSDLPLDPASNLSGRLRPSEGIPPLYAVTREILAGVIESEYQT